MKHLVRFSKVALVFCIVLTAGCDAFDSQSGSKDDLETGPGGIFQYKNFSHYEAKREVTIDTTTLTTSITSRVNIVANGDTVFKRVPVGKATGLKVLKAGTPYNLEARAYPSGKLLTGLKATMKKEGMKVTGPKYVLMTFGYKKNIQPVVIRRNRPEAPEQPAQEGKSTFNLLHGVPNIGPVDVYTNRPAEADSLEPSVDELSPTYSEVPYLALADPVTVKVSEEAGNSLHVRVTPAGDTTTVVDQEVDFGAGDDEFFILKDLDKVAKDDSMNVKMSRAGGNGAVKKINL